MPDEKIPLHDSMNMGDLQVEVDLRCAFCNEPVQAGQPHTCEQKENYDADSTESE